MTRAAFFHRLIDTVHPLDPHSGSGNIVRAARQVLFKTLLHAAAFGDAYVVWLPALGLDPIQIGLSFGSLLVPVLLKFTVFLPMVAFL